MPFKSNSICVGKDFWSTVVKVLIEEPSNTQANYVIGKEMFKTHTFNNDLEKILTHGNPSW